MTINYLNVGKDVVIDLVDPMTGGAKSFAIITSFESKALTNKLKSVSLDGISRYGTEYQGFEGTITLDRATPGMDDFFAERERLYHSGVNMIPMTLTETIQEQDGSFTTWRYTGVDCEFPEHGTWKNGGLIVQKLSFRASQRLKV
jgi:hypothetical protein